MLICGHAGKALRHLVKFQPGIAHAALFVFGQAAEIGVTISGQQQNGIRVLLDLAGFTQICVGRFSPCSVTVQLGQSHNEDAGCLGQFMQRNGDFGDGVVSVAAAALMDQLQIVHENDICFHAESLRLDPRHALACGRANVQRPALQVVFFKENGEFDAVKTNEVLGERLQNMENAVVPGFYGANPDGSIRTFSRGGSDITGSIVAKAVHADVYENWTDVSGFLIADPNIIPNPEKIETITYRELRELSYMGASVLHEEAIFPVRSEGIPINIRNTNEPDNSGTWIVESTCQKSKFVITGIAGKRGFCSVNIEKDMMNSEIGFGRRILQAFEDNGISFEHVPSGIDTMTVFVHQDEFMDKEQNVVAAIHRLAKPDMIDIEGDLALIAVVGRGMRSTRGTAGLIIQMKQLKSAI